MKRTISILVCMVMMLGLVVGCGKKEEQSQEGANGDSATPIVLRCGITVSKDSVPAEALEVFADRVSEATEGSVQLEVHYDGTLGNERDVIEGVSMGTIEMYAGSTAPLSNFVDDFNIWDLPYVVDMNNIEDAYEIMDGEIGKKMLESLSEIGVKGLGIGHQGFRCMLNSEREVTVPDDAKGLVIRTMENDIHLDFYKEIGANPTAMASTEAFTALAQGTIAGMDNILDAFYTQGAFESAKHLTLTGHIISGYVFCINSSVFDSMTKEQQEAVVAAGKEASQFVRDRSMEKMEEIVKNAQEQYGVTVTEVDTKVWKEASAKMVEKYKDTIDPEYWNAFYE